jgi:hypothetical protein
MGGTRCFWKQERQFWVVIFGDQPALNVRFETGSPTIQLALFLRLRSANRANKLQGMIGHSNPLLLSDQFNQDAAIAAFTPAAAL